MQNVMENISAAEDRQKYDYQKRQKASDVGENVLLWKLRRAERKCGKMQDPWLGPYTVHADLENSMYELKNTYGIVLAQKAYGTKLKMHCKRQY